MTSLDRARFELDVGQLSALAVAGLSLTDLAAVFRVSRDTLVRHLEAHGYGVVAPTGRRPALPADMAVAVHALRTTCGYSNRKIALLLGVNRSTIDALVAAQNLPPRDPLSKRVGTATVGVVLSMARDGHSSSEIARQLGVRAHSTVRSIIQRHAPELVTPRPTTRGGRRRNRVHRRV